MSIPILAQKHPSNGLLVRIPYGMHPVDGIFVDDTEITVEEWLEFYYYSQDSTRAIPNPVYHPHFPQENKPSYAFLFKIDTSALCLKYNEMSNGEIRRPIPVPKDSVHSHRSFKRFCRRYMDYPIAYISYEQAIAYCDWRSKLVSQDKNYSFEFRLLSPAEIDLWNENLDSLVVNKYGTWATGNYKDSYQSPKFCKRCGQKAIAVASLFSGKTLLYDIQGNLAEMTLTKGVAMGGSFIHPYYESRKGHQQVYTKPEPWLGFRCVAIVHWYRY
ncbi:SUMF1/EgtB/PvdO family nonheme iron enzyme [Cytophagaceae bacterium YF14B1]|uniref:SUMF1/EgtB/PvdO family nonheme iron enzyme n=1 Tax=Xanthocytophaga flava TaxID=3048013 RepID=A0AAE3U755_9BACT|nr:SUMF1/EgtB/PvdO family nonheme iron enzyme [Xanthocytophaga flavus]MDJ1482564.1 SUMF1/EgtB/PvdO family nonheme iron enzyme [Xanthocytophaga flavus]